MTVLFADTFFLLALGSPGDSVHHLAIRHAGRCDATIVTTAWVLTELADALHEPRNRPAFIKLLGGMRANRAVEIIPPDANLFDRGVDLYASRPDKAWSLTDCVSFVVMTDRGLTEALTGDHHFEQAGFRALLREA